MLPTNHRTPQIEERPVDIVSPLVAHLRSPIPNEPRKRPFHHLPTRPQPLATPKLDAPSSQELPILSVVLGLVCAELSGTLPGSTPRALDRFDATEQFLEDGRVAGVGRRVSPYAMLVAVALAVAAVPEGLPAGAVSTSRSLFRGTRRASCCGDRSILPAAAAWPASSAGRSPR